jgi:hypothetical protein
VGMFVCLCLVSKKPSEREFVVPAGTDLVVTLLNKDDILEVFCSESNKFSVTSSNQI